MAFIFISYRRDGSGGWAGWLAEGLRRRFRASDVFIDVGTIQPGDPFPETIPAAIQSCHCFLCLISPGWLATRGNDGTRRLDDPSDFLRREIELALAATSTGLRIIPILVGGATVPTAADLPPSLARLAEYDSVTLSAKAWHADVLRLTRSIERLLRKWPVAGRGWIIAAVLLSICVGGWTAWNSTYVRDRFVPRATPIHWWGANSEFRDMASHASPSVAATPVGNVRVAGDGERRLRYYEFDGNSILTLPSATLPAGDSDRTVMLWVMFKRLLPDEAPYWSSSVFFSYGEVPKRSKDATNLQSTDPSSGAVYHIGLSKQGIVFSTWGYSIATGIPPLTGKWYHVAVTNIGANCVLYVDGMRIPGRPMAIDTKISSSAYLGGVPESVVLDSGKNGRFNWVQYNLVGRIADLQIFGEALTEAQIGAAYRGGLVATQ